MAEGMTETPPEVGDELFDRARAEFTEGQLVELCAEIAFENDRARFNRVFDIEAPGATREEK